MVFTRSYEDESEAKNENEKTQRGNKIKIIKIVNYFLHNKKSKNKNPKLKSNERR